MSTDYTCGYPVGAQYKKVCFTTSTWLRDQLKIHATLEGWKAIVGKRLMETGPRKTCKKLGSKMAIAILKYLETHDGCKTEEVIFKAFLLLETITAKKIICGLDKLMAKGEIYRTGKFGHDEWHLKENK